MYSFGIHSEKPFSEKSITNQTSVTSQTTDTGLVESLGAGPPSNETNETFSKRPIPVRITTRPIKEYRCPSSSKAAYRSTSNLINIQPIICTTKHAFPTIFFSNTRSMVNKLDELHASISTNNCDIAIITESWLSPHISDDLISLPNFATIRKDRPEDQRGGGLCTYINNNLNFLELDYLSDPQFETQWFLLKPNRLPRGISSIIMATVYHPPQNKDYLLRDHLFQSLDTALAEFPNAGIILLGDFNQFTPSSLCSSFKLKKLVKKPTWGVNTLDQAYSTLSCHYNEALILPPIGMSDHSSVLLNPKQLTSFTQPTKRILRRDSRNMIYL